MKLQGSNPVNFLSHGLAGEFILVFLNLTGSRLHVTLYLFIFHYELLAVHGCWFGVYLLYLFIFFRSYIGHTWMCVCY